MLVGDVIVLLPCVCCAGLSVVFGVACVFFGVASGPVCFCFALELVTAALWCILVAIGYLISFLVVLFGGSLGAAGVRFVCGCGLRWFGVW